MGDARARIGVLSHGHLFGLKANVKSNVHFVDENTLAYPCGHNVILLHLETRAQQVGQRQQFCTHHDQHTIPLPSGTHSDFDQLFAGAYCQTLYAFNLIESKGHVPVIYA